MAVLHPASFRSPAVDIRTGHFTPVWERLLQALLGEDTTDAMNSLTLVQSQQLTSTAVVTLLTSGTSPKKRTSLEVFTVCNTTGTAATLTVFLVPSGGAADATARLVDARSVAANSTERLLDLVGQVLESGDSLRVQAGTANALTIRVSGREKVIL